MILLGIFGADATALGAKLSTWIIIISVIIIVWIFGSAARWWRGWDSITRFMSQDAVALVVILLIFGVVIAFITGGEKEADTTSSLRNAGEALKDVFTKR